MRQDRDKQWVSDGIKVEGITRFLQGPLGNNPTLKLGKMWEALWHMHDYHSSIPVTGTLCFGCKTRTLTAPRLSIQWQ